MLDLMWLGGDCIASHDRQKTLLPNYGNKPAMPYSKELNAEVLSAVRQFARSASLGRPDIADMSKLVAATSHLCLTNLSKWERLLRWEFADETSVTLPSGWKMRSKPSLFLTWMDIWSDEGFRRETALRTLSGPAPNAFFLAMAARRLNDWVPQVREAARVRLPVIAADTDPDIVVDVLCATLPAWNLWGRMEDKDKQALIDIASVQRVRDALKTRIVSATAGPMTAVLSQASGAGILECYLDEIARMAIQPSVRAKAYRYLLEGKMVWSTGTKWEWTDIRYCEGRPNPVLSERTLPAAPPFLVTLNMAALDRSVLVRRVAVDMLIRHPEKAGDESLKLAELLASDCVPSVAERGRYAVERTRNNRVY
jgi:hypothetical protein